MQHVSRTWRSSTSAQSKEDCRGPPLSSLANTERERGGVARRSVGHASKREATLTAGCPIVHLPAASVQIHLRESNSTQEARLGLQPVSSSWSPMVRDFPALAHSVRGCPNLFDQPLYLKEDPFAFFLGEPLVGVFRFISLVPQIVKIAQQGLPKFAA